MKVLLTKRFFKSDLEYIKKRVPDSIIFLNEDFVKDELINLAKEADVFFGGLIDKDLVVAAENLKFIQIPWNGVDNLDWELIESLDITLCNSHSNAFVVAEHAVALLFDALKKISHHDRLMREGNWNRIFPGVVNDVSPFSSSLREKRIGILGFGSIGKSIYRMLGGFECDFKVFNRTGFLDEFYTDLTSYPMTDLNLEVTDLDVLFIALPLTAETNSLIDQDCFNSMPENLVLVNISRGAIVNEEALYNSLKSKIIGWAAIDTWYSYPNVENPIKPPSINFPFESLQNITMSPHRAGYIDSGFPHLDDAIENLNRSLKEEGLINVISVKNKY
jgi:phosphoglycerate dehydrogenase-like enzyme